MNYYSFLPNKRVFQSLKGPIRPTESENTEAAKPLHAGEVCGEQLGAAEADCPAPSLPSVGPGSNLSASPNLPSPG